MRSKEKRVTHRDVARLAHVSPAVVSYVINNGPRPTSPATRERVLKAIEELSYHPNAAARGLRVQRTRTIGYISYDYYPDRALLAPYNTSVLSSLTAALKVRQHYILPYPLQVGEDLTGIVALLGSRRVDGVVVRLAEDPPVTDGLLDVIAASGVPCVCLERPGAARFGFSWITYDDEGGAYSATHYLIARGHRRIAHLQGDPRQQAAHDRLAGYRRALVEAEVPVDERLIQGRTWVPADAIPGIRSLLHLAEPPSAIFAANDQLAFSSVEVLRAHGLRVPEDVAVVGFDDTLLAQDMVPPLTTVRIPFDDLGRLAADLILRLADDGETGPETVTVTLEIVSRGTA
jgi:DNA-binding LacI/PurR family transcriptional regulator